MIDNLSRVLYLFLNIYIFFSSFSFSSIIFRVTVAPAPTAARTAEFDGCLMVCARLFLIGLFFRMFGSVVSFSISYSLRLCSTLLNVFSTSSRPPWDVVVFVPLIDGNTVNLT